MKQLRAEHASLVRTNKQLKREKKQLTVAVSVFCNRPDPVPEPVNEVEDFLERRWQELQLTAFAESNVLGNLTKTERTWFRTLAREARRIRETENRDMTVDDMTALKERVAKKRRK